MNKEKIDFGTIIYRPCISYAGRKNFINPSVVREVIIKDDESFVLSFDAFRQSWTDRPDDEGETFFLDKEKAEEKLRIMIEKKNARKVNKYENVSRDKVCSL
jgi:predicted RNA-binding protein with PUA domain